LHRNEVLTAFFPRGEENSPFISNYYRNHNRYSSHDVVYNYHLGIYDTKKTSIEALEQPSTQFLFLISYPYPLDLGSREITPIKAQTKKHRNGASPYNWTGN